jgi:hypothetical protein
LSSFVGAYLNALMPQKNVAAGVFATTGSDRFHDEDIASLGKQVASFSFSSTLNKMPVTKTIRSGDAGNGDCSDFVSAVLQ